jgi:triacylglycerol lipase
MNKLGEWVVDYLAAARYYAGGLFQGGGVEPTLGGTDRPVLILPGVYEPWTFMLPLIRHLLAKGHSVHVVADLGFNRKRIPKSAAIAQAYLESNGLENVTIVAHSKGGLIAKHMMLHDDPDGRIGKLIAISTPFAGSRRARFFFIRTVRDFLPDDSTVTLLGSGAGVNARITSIYSEWDLHIPETSGLPGATNVPIPIGGHFRVIGHPLVLAALDDALGDERGPVADEPNSITNKQGDVEQSPSNDEAK